MQKEEDTLNLKECSDAELLEKFSKGNTNAYVEVLERYEEPLINFLKKYTVCSEECRDIVQDTLFTLYKYKERTSEIKTLSTWLFSVSINNAKRRITRADIFDSLDEDKIDEQYLYKYHTDEFTEEADDFDARNISVEKLKAAFEKLEPHYKEAILLRIDQDMDYEQIAETLNISVGTVKSRINRAKEKLRKLLEGYYE